MPHQRLPGAAEDRSPDGPVPAALVSEGIIHVACIVPAGASHVSCGTHGTFLDFLGYQPAESLCPP